jgi:hypothetical protein
MDHFDASTPPADVAQPALRAADVQDADLRLGRALDRVADLVAQVQEREAEQGLDRELVAILEEITSAADAPVELASIGRRVREGFTTWEQVWRDPEPDAGARRLVMTAQRIVNERTAAAWAEGRP